MKWGMGGKDPNEIIRAEELNYVEKQLASDPQAKEVVNRIIDSETKNGVSLSEVLNERLKAIHFEIRWNKEEKLKLKAECRENFSAEDYPKALMMYYLFSKNNCNADAPYETKQFRALKKELKLSPRDFTSGERMLAGSAKTMYSLASRVKGLNDDPTSQYIVNVDDAIELVKINKTEKAIHEDVKNAFGMDTYHKLKSIAESVEKNPVLQETGELTRQIPDQGERQALCAMTYPVIMKRFFLQGKLRVDTTVKLAPEVREQFSKLDVQYGQGYFKEIKRLEDEYIANGVLEGRPEQSLQRAGEKRDSIVKWGEEAKTAGKDSLGISGQNKSGLEGTERADKQHEF